MNFVMARKGDNFYDQESTLLAKALLGQTLVRVVNGERMSGRIVEVESYLGGEDAASHSHNGRRTPRNEAMYMKPGTAYVYSIYGMYYCFNISSRGAGSCVLLRALEPMEGQELMTVNRASSRRKKNNTSEGSTALSTKRFKIHELCNGPSKLCTALQVDKLRCNKLDMSQSDLLFLESGDSVLAEKIVACKRIGIDSCGAEWADKPLRFYELGNPCVSVRNKQIEAEMLSRQFIT